MFSNNYVVAVKGSTNKVLREISGTVYLPFHSEYSILLKNNNSHRCVCSVEIDGTDVLGGNELIVDSQGSLNLERFMVDGDLTKGQRFKFVPLSDSRVSDPSSSDNGIIEVKFWKEIDRTYYFPPVKAATPFRCYPLTNIRGTGDFHSDNVFMSSMDMSSGNNPEVNTNAFQCCAGTPGATVEGSVSNQSFTYGDFQGKDGAPTIIRLKMLSCDREEVTVQKTKRIHCTKCGKKSSFFDSFCRHCGTRLKKAAVKAA